MGICSPVWCAQQEDLRSCPLCVSHFQIKRAIRGQQETLHVQERFVAGSLAGATAQTIIYPMEVRRRDSGRGAIAGWGGLQ